MRLHGITPPVVPFVQYHAVGILEFEISHSCSEVIFRKTKIYPDSQLTQPRGSLPSIASLFVSYIGH